MSHRILTAAILAAAIGAAACQFVAGLDGDFKEGKAPDDAGADAEAGPAGCVRATYADPPSASDGPNLSDIILAMRTIDFGESTQPPPGYDLDGACTCFADAGPTCVSEKQHCDAPGGIDNASAQFFNLVQFAVGPSNFSSAAYSSRIEQGDFTLLARVMDYSGEADDPSVVVAMYPSPGTSDVTPLWDGNDLWEIASQSVIDADPNQPLFASAAAYVSKGTLVAAIPAIEAQLGSEENSITMHLTGGVLTAKLSKGATGWTMKEGVIAARWKIDDVFAALSTYRDGQGKPICTDIGFAYDSAKGAVCSGLDILADPTSAKTEPCDALSIGLGFTAHEAKIGMIAPAPMPFPGCPPESDPAYDSCF